jgi:hypothetical protein
MKLKNCCANVSSALCAILCVLCFLYIWLSSANPSFHDEIEEITRVRPRCSSFSRAALNWSFSRCDFNLPIFSLAVRVLAFSTTLVNSEFEVINCLLSFVWERPQIQFLVHTVQPSRGSGTPASWSSCSFFVQIDIAALYPPGPSLCLNLFFMFNSFILLLKVMASGVVYVVLRTCPIHLAWYTQIDSAVTNPSAHSCWEHV